MGICYVFYLSSRFRDLGSYAEARAEIEAVSQLSEGYQFAALIATRN